MKYKIEYTETIKKLNTVTIEVEGKEHGEEIADKLYEKARHYNHPDDIFCDLSDMGIKVLEKCEGAEDCEYEIE